MEKKLHKRIDDVQAKRKKCNKLLNGYSVPKFFEDNLFRHADEKRPLPNRWYSCMECSRFYHKRWRLVLTGSTRKFGNAQARRWG
ncbi:Bifunctional arginine demethylase and lysyl-hydroxylase psr-1 [Trichinella murrelli]|uniref:Bifunctional arginine demethylase and lysyl-hydroxylase psr-1 n=1 Tax=Trichinella murrelli TaxID=144512 RepID=A0A0V0U9U1_9BILA|nr:Bifunctional arginine demethylase and lysyl-hydroxylase psr-1 [Trichinella murrelli]